MRRRRASSRQGRAEEVWDLVEGLMFTLQLLVQVSATRLPSSRCSVMESTDITTLGISALVSGGTTDKFFLKKSLFFRQSAPGTLSFVFTLIVRVARTSVEQNVTAIALVVPRPVRTIRTGKIWGRWFLNLQLFITEASSLSIFASSLASRGSLTWRSPRPEDCANVP